MSNQEVATKLNNVMKTVSQGFLNFPTAKEDPIGNTKFRSSTTSMFKKQRKITAEGKIYLARNKDFVEKLKHHDISKDRISDQLDYIGSKYQKDHYSNFSPQKGINFQSVQERDKDWFKMSHDTLDVAESRFDSGKMISEINSKYKRSFQGQVQMKRQYGRGQPNVQLNMVTPQN